MKYSVLILSIFFVITLLGGCADSNTLNDAITNYKERDKEINDLINYYLSKTPVDQSIMFGLGKGESFNLGIALSGGRIDAQRPAKGGINIAKKSTIADSLLRSINWTNEIVDSITFKLKASKCVSITNGEPIRLAYNRNGLTQYTYLIYSTPLPDSTLSRKGVKEGVINNRVIVSRFSGL
ncbi:MAG: hypothetical protein E6Q24_03195 [Chitinophagaceae bacterium]|nr:MAG: hypothetical protein E6Q24_03195 [Chitinophagaceae bacterium]